jgi:hypothetical protein
VVLFYSSSDLLLTIHVPAADADCPLLLLSQAVQVAPFSCQSALERRVGTTAALVACRV